MPIALSRKNTGALGRTEYQMHSNAWYNNSDEVPFSFCLMSEAE